ncbi:MAG TPA: response regulator transcription factor [Candidatus Baltobacteraceae bacterium]|jgi:DNA-binding NarL/FixJ family response regulator|nr:response regulator transcription factor [Candidatus Baltobacteraceae bacterium]
MSKRFFYDDPVRVAVIEPDRASLPSLVRMLRSDENLVIVDEAVDVDSSRLTTSSPDVIVIDLDSWPTDTGGNLEHRLKQCRIAVPSARVCALSFYIDSKLAQRTMAARAAAFVVKDTSAERLCEIVHDCAHSQDESYADPRLVGKLLHRNVQGNRANPELSSRELEIVSLITAGLSNREIGTRLSLSEKTVKNHVSRVFVKLGVKTRSNVAVYALLHGLI